MKLAILTAVLDDFDTIVDPVKQFLHNPTIEYDFIRITDKEFPPIKGLTPRFQYRIPKYFGWQMYPGYDYYLWLDGGVSLTSDKSLAYFYNRCLDRDMVVFKHPWRNSIAEEVQHIDDYLNRKSGTKKGQDYLIRRYENGLHKEQLKDIQYDTDYMDDHLYASTAFMYRDSERVRDAFRNLFLHQARYFTCDQLAFTYCIKDLDIRELDEDVFKNEYIGRVSNHD